MKLYAAMTLALGLGACASSPEQNAGAGGADPLCMKAGVHVAALMSGTTEADIKSGDHYAAIKEGCSSPEARDQASQDMFKCSLEADDVDSLNACHPPEGMGEESGEGEGEFDAGEGENLPPEDGGAPEN